MPISSMPSANMAGRTRITSALRYGFPFEVERPSTSRARKPKPESRATIDPRTVSQFAQRREISVARRKRHPSLLQRADVGDQRVDRGRIELVLEALHLGIALLDAVGDRVLDLRVGLALLKLGGAQVLELQLLALIGLPLSVGAVARGALRLPVALGLLVDLGPSRCGTDRRRQQQESQATHARLSFSN